MLSSAGRLRGKCRQQPAGPGETLGPWRCRWRAGPGLCGLGAAPCSGARGEDPPCLSVPRVPVCVACVLHACFLSIDASGGPGVVWSPLLRLLPGCCPCLPLTLWASVGSSVECVLTSSISPCRSFSYLLAELFSLFSPLNFLTELSSFYYSLYP